MDITDRLESWAEQCEGPLDDDIREIVNELRVTRADRDLWISKTQTAVWSDSEYCKFLEREHRRLYSVMFSISTEELEVAPEMVKFQRDEWRRRAKEVADVKIND